MYKNLQYAILLTFALPAMAWNVETTPTNKSIVIEEYTGIHCGNCPDGHKRAAMLHHANPEDVFLVAVHAGGFATPAPSEPNYITDAGQAIHDFFEVSSYPCGTVSRRDVGLGLVQGRGDWGASARVIAAETSPVNLWSECKYDKASRKLEVAIEGYFTGTMENPKLTVEILQDNILGPQAGGLMGVEYPHRHMLRAMLNNDTFGDDILFSGVGTYFKKEYSFSLPEDINGVSLVDSNLQILAFVSEGKGEIVKAAKCWPIMEAGDSASDIFVQSESLISIGKNHALGYVELFIDNYSYRSLNEATFEVKLNKMNETISWNGEVAPHSEQMIQVALPHGWEEILDNDDNNLSIKMITANGFPTALEVLPLKYSFSKIAEYPDELTIKITTDIEAADNSFCIIDPDGKRVAEFGPYPDGENKLYEEHVKLEKGKVYGFEVFDSWGNGMYHPRGSVKFYGPDGKICGQIMEISNYGTRHFFRTADDSAIGDVVADKTIKVEYFNLLGKKIENPESGVSIRVSTLSDGSRIVTKIIGE